MLTLRELRGRDLLERHKLILRPRLHLMKTKKHVQRPSSIDIIVMGCLTLFRLLISKTQYPAFNPVILQNYRTTTSYLAPVTYFPVSGRLSSTLNEPYTTSAPFGFFEIIRIPYFLHLALSHYPTCRLKFEGCPVHHSSRQLGWHSCPQRNGFMR